MDLRWFYSLIWLWIRSGLIRADGHGKEPLMFHCPGDEDMIAFLEDGRTMQQVCGPDFKLMFNASMEMLQDGKLMMYFSSFPDPEYGVPLMPSLVDMGSTSYGWSLPHSATIDQDHLPCGAGYLVAEVHNMGKKHTASRRVVRTCDYSDIDISLEIDVTVPKQTVMLYPEGKPLMAQLQDNNVHIRKIEVMNHGNRRLMNATMENPHKVMVFLRRHGELETMMDAGCSVPSFRLGDSPLGSMMFVDRIEPHTSREIEEDPMEPIRFRFNEVVAICGDAELVLLLDPLATLNDSNPCNNFMKLPVHVDCSMAAKADVCMNVANAINLGHETFMMFQDMSSMSPKIYKYKAMDLEWQNVDIHDQDMHTELVGLGKFMILEMLLKHVYDKYYHGKFPCDNVKPMITSRLATKFDRIMDRSNYTIDPNIMRTMEMLKTRLINLDIMSDMDSLRSDIEMFGNNTYMYSMDEVMKAKIRGLSYGFQYAMGIQYSIKMAQMMNHRIPNNMTRTVVGPMIRPFADMIWHMSEQVPMMQRYMIPTLVQHAAQMSILLTTGLFQLPDNIQQNLETLVDNIMDFPDMMVQDSNNMMSCDKSHLEMAARYLHYLSMGHDGEMESEMDQSTCNRLMVASYMRHGGAFLHGKDILHAVEEMDMDSDTPMQCRRHPYLSDSIPPCLWNMKDGLVYSGSYSPIADKMTWKVAAMCRCDGCPNDPSMTMDHTTSWQYETTRMYDYPLSSESAD